MSEHYFSASPTSAAAEHAVTVTLAGREVQVLTSGGVFSGGRLDLGTRVLLREAPVPEGDQLLDVGCGWGPLALTMALQRPTAVVWAVDVNQRARDLTTANAARVGASGVRVCAPDDVPDDVRFSTIWSNPPIRIGKSALHALLLHWLPRLQDDGVAYLVVQRNLGADSLHDWLVPGLGERTGEDWTVVRAGSAKGYRVLRLTRTG